MKRFFSIPSPTNATSHCGTGRNLAWQLIALIAASTLVTSNAAEPKQGASLLKTDIMVVLAHPDDETGLATTIAHYALGEKKAVVNVYATRGEGGGNMVGTQWGPSLGILRETELRQCLETLGVRSCYFLDRLDWAYTESAEATMRKWNKEETLERLVRLVRALRPDVIITMKPAPRPGSHGHHQAAGILAIEAFSAAADPTRFPLQLTKEGLTAWQARRLYFGGSDAKVVSTIAVDKPLADGRTPAQVAGSALVNHRSQAFGNFSASSWMQRPRTFTLVSAFVPVAGSETDLLAGLPVPDSKLAPVQFPKPPQTDFRLEFAPRPAVANYNRWVKEQGIEHVAQQFPADLPVVSGEPNDVELQLHNTGKKVVVGNLNLHAPAGWSIEEADRLVRILPGSSTSVGVRLIPPIGNLADADLKATIVVSGQKFEAAAKLHPLPRARARRLTTRPAIDGTSRGWEKVPALSIAPTNRVQGKIANEADSSAIFRVAQDGTRFFVDVEVKDDAIISNIAPNDIKGHWRSDSVEICFDPAIGPEHTLGSYKIGIFPFDSTDVVRAARDADANQGPIEETAPGTRVFSVRTPDGYRIQASIPFSEIGLKANQKRVGFNIIIYDGDKLDAAPGENINKSRIAWAPRSGVQGRPEDWGRIDLD